MAMKTYETVVAGRKSKRNTQKYLGGQGARGIPEAWNGLELKMGAGAGEAYVVRILQGALMFMIIMIF